MEKVNKSVFRKDLKDFFELSGILKSVELKHTPFIVMGEQIELCRSAIELVSTYAPETEVIVQWVGKWRSDYFYMHVYDVKNALEGVAVVEVV